MNDLPADVVKIVRAWLAEHPGATVDDAIASLIRAGAPAADRGVVEIPVILLDALLRCAHALQTLPLGCNTPEDWDSKLQLMQQRGTSVIAFAREFVVPSDS